MRERKGLPWGRGSPALQGGCSTAQRIRKENRQKKGGQRGSPFSFLVQTPSPGYLAQVPALEAAPG